LVGFAGGIDPNMSDLFTGRHWKYSHSHFPNSRWVPRN
jgi:hypothetical protein